MTHADNDDEPNFWQENIFSSGIENDFEVSLLLLLCCNDFQSKLTIGYCDGKEREENFWTSSNDAVVRLRVGDLHAVG